MKLLSCYINGFGKLTDCTINFESDLTALCAENGFGKTTLTAFIEAMFYGLEKTQGKTKGFTHRKHFYPFEEHCTFGGSLTFLYQNKTYRIERTFGLSAPKDTLKVYENNIETTILGEVPGVKLFGIDKESFNRTVLFDADDQILGSTAGINEKLCRFLEGGEDDITFETAKSTLETAMKRYKAQRGKGGLIDQYTDECHELERKIFELNKLNETLTPLYAERNEASFALEKLNAEAKTAHNYELLKEKWSQFDAVKQQKERQSEALKQLNLQYPKGIPNEQEQQKLQTALQQTNEQTALQKQAVFAPEKAESLAKLAAKFKGDIPTEAQLNSIAEKLQAERDATFALNRLENESEKDAKNRTLPDEAQMATVTEKEKQYLALQNSPQSPKENKKGISVIGLIAAGLLIAAGSLLFLLGKTAGILLAGAGIVALIFTLFFSVKSQPNLANEQTRLQLLNLQNEIYAIIAPLGYHSENGVLYDIATLKSDMLAAKENRLEKENAEQQKRKLKDDITAFRQDISLFFTAYGFADGGDMNTLQQLKQQISEYHSLLNEQKSAENKAKEIAEKLQQSAKETAEILTPYQLQNTPLNWDILKQFAADYGEQKRLEKAIAEAEEKLAKLKQENNLTALPEIENLKSGSEIEAEQTELMQKIAQLDRKISATEQETERLPELSEQLDNTGEALQQAAEKFGLLQKTLQAITETEAELNNRYLAPVAKRMEYYAGLIDEKIWPTVQLTPNLDIDLFVLGKQRESDHLSAGQRTVLSLIMRLAFMDCIFENEQPFILMDDPFVHLDAPHMAEAAKVVKSLSKEHQIIYYTCHQSRMI